MKVLVVALVFMFSSCDIVVEMEPGAFSVELYVDAGLCETDDDCSLEYPFCYSLGEIGLCLNCFSDIQNQQSICGFLEAIEEE